MRDTIDMAREAGYGEHLSMLHAVALNRFAELVRADEREAIIDLVAMYGGSVDLEAAIRARSKDEK